MTSSPFLLYRPAAGTFDMSTAFDGLAMSMRDGAEDDYARPVFLSLRQEGAKKNCRGSVGDDAPNNG